MTTLLFFRFQRCQIPRHFCTLHWIAKHSFKTLALKKCQQYAIVDSFKFYLKLETIADHLCICRWQLWTDFKRLLCHFLTSLLEVVQNPCDCHSNGWKRRWRFRYDQRKCKWTHLNTILTRKKCFWTRERSKIKASFLLRSTPARPFRFDLKTSSIYKLMVLCSGPILKKHLFVYCRPMATPWEPVRPRFLFFVNVPGQLGLPGRLVSGRAWLSRSQIA